MAVRGLSVLSRIYRRSGKGCAFHEPDRLLVYASDELISVTCVFGIVLGRSSQGKAVLGCLGHGRGGITGKGTFLS